MRITLGAGERRLHLSTFTKARKTYLFGSTNELFLSSVAAYGSKSSFRKTAGIALALLRSFQDILGDRFPRRGRLWRVTNERARRVECVAKYPGCLRIKYRADLYKSSNGGHGALRGQGWEPDIKLLRNFGELMPVNGPLGGSGALGQRLILVHPPMMMALC